jgi:hypothetical protein
MNWSLLLVLVIFISPLLLIVGLINPKLTMIKPFQKRDFIFSFYSTVTILAFLGLVIALSPNDWSTFFFFIFLISLLSIAIGFINPKLVIIKPFQKRKITFLFYLIVSMLSLVTAFLTVDTSDILKNSSYSASHNQINKHSKYGIELEEARCFQGKVDTILDDSRLKGGSSVPYFHTDNPDFIQLKVGNFRSGVTKDDYGTHFDYCIYVKKVAPEGFHDFSINMTSALKWSKAIYKHKFFVVPVQAEKKYTAFESPQNICNLFSQNGFQEREIYFEPVKPLCFKELIIKDDKIDNKDLINLKILPGLENVAKEIEVGLSLRYSYSIRDYYEIGKKSRRDAINKYIEALNILFQELGYPIPSNMVTSISSKANATGNVDEDLEFLSEDSLVRFEYRNGTSYAAYGDYMTITIKNWHLGN